MLSFFADRYDKANMERSLLRQSALTPTPFKMSDLPSFSRISDGEAFFAFNGSAEPISFDGSTVLFSGEGQADQASSDTFECVVTDSGSKHHALVVFHHWYSRNRYPAFAKFFASRGITVVEVTLPHHFGRSGRQYGEEQLFNADIGGTVHSIRQAVLEGRKVLSWLRSQGYFTLSVVGMCIGGLIAGLIAANDDRVNNAVMMVTPPSPADLVWTGATFKRLRSIIEPHMTLEELREAWAIISLEGHLFGLTRSNLNLLFVNGSRDSIVRPEPFKRLSDHLESMYSPVELLELGCGHSSVGMFPFNLLAARRVYRFLAQVPSLREYWEMRHFRYDFTETTFAKKSWFRGGQ
jgi:pimeloyl-ACP methyl ester carboxylesterase